MTLVKYRRPGINYVGKNFSDIMDEFFNDAVSTRQNSFVPVTDVSETDKQYEIQVHLPGLTKEDITVDVEGGHLRVSGERKLENETKNKTFHRVETSYGSFTRTFELPDNIDQDSVQAAYKDGILTISIDKNEEKAKKQIAIK